MSKELIKLWDSLDPKPWQVRDEFLEFLDFIQVNRIKNILEIGAHKGGSASAFLKLGCKVTSVDIVKQPEIEDLVNSDKLGRFQFRFRDEFSFSDPAYVREEEGLAYDLLWIDGDHAYAGCLKDYEDYKDLVNPGGWIAFHDSVKSELHKTQECEVWKVINFINPDRRIEIIKDGKWGGITIIRKEA